jgi:hypothetical protein
MPVARLELEQVFMVWALESVLGLEQVVMQHCQ